MTLFQRAERTACVVALLLMGLVFLAVRPYEYRVSALFHVDERIAAEQALPKGFVVLQDPAYDGAMYYRIAERLPALLSPARWHELTEVTPGAYAYQRFLLPLLAYTLVLGNVAWLPWSFLLINLTCLIASAVLVQRSTKHALPALAVALCPSATIGLFFSTAEPLNILLLTLFLLRFSERKTIDVGGGLLLCLCILTREVNAPLLLFCALWCVVRRDWQSLLWTFPALATFVVWQGFISLVFGSVPFLVNGSNLALPLTAPLSILFGFQGFNRYTLSSVALLLLFVLPAAGWTMWRLLKERTQSSLPLTLLAGYLFIMFTMPLHIWGSITSIGRAITPVYPLSVFVFERAGRMGSALLIAMILLGLGAAVGLASIVHPYVVV